LLRIDRSGGGGGGAFLGAGFPAFGFALCGGASGSAGRDVGSIPKEPIGADRELQDDSGPAIAAATAA
jgi:hypothetical protein